MDSGWRVGTAPPIGTRPAEFAAVSGARVFVCTMRGVRAPATVGGGTTVAAVTGCHRLRDLGGKRDSEFDPRFRHLVVSICQHISALEHPSCVLLVKQKRDDEVPKADAENANKQVQHADANFASEQWHKPTE